MSNAIVVLNVSQQVAPLPNTLQQTGALISQGATTLLPQTMQIISQMSDLTALLDNPTAITSITWSSGVATYTTTAPHGWTIGDVLYLTIAGATPNGYNGNYLSTVTGASTFTAPISVNPGSETVPGSVFVTEQVDLIAMATTYFAQPGVPAIYVLELGETTITEGVAALGVWLGNNPKTVYSFCVPHTWDNNGPFLALLTTFVGTTALTYFFVTTTIAHQAAYAGMKCVYACVPTLGIQVTEFQAAARLGVTLAYNPNSSNRVPPLSYAFLAGVTPYPLPGNASVLAGLAAANVNWVGTGAEGGLSNAIEFYGQLSDGKPFNYWYAADYAQLQLDLNLTNEVIIGSNSTLAPLYYDQQGINRLQNRSIQTLGQAIAAGLGVGQLKATNLPATTFAANYEAGLYTGFIVVNAEPFLVYSAENPSDFSIGKYGGLAAVFTASRGFRQVFFNLTVTNIIVA